MKVLDSHTLYSGIGELQKNISKQLEKIKQLEELISSFAENKDILDGKGGEAIRSFFKEVHLPFLLFQYNALQNFNQTLSNLKIATESLEPEVKGFIRQSFLEQELKNGVNRIKLTTTDLVEEANAKLDNVSDIISVQRFEDDAFLNEIQNADSKITETINDLGVYDSSQAKELDLVEQDIQLMKSYLDKVEGMFTSGRLSVASYKTKQLYKEFNSPLSKDILKKLTVSSEYEAMNELIMYNYSDFDPLFNRNTTVSKYNTIFNSVYLEKSNKNINKENEIANKVKSDDGIGNMDVSASRIEDVAVITTGASVVDTEKMDNVPDYLGQKVLFGESKVSVPLSRESITNSLLYGQNLGMKVEAGVSKSTFSSDKSPVSADFLLGQGELKANIENYTMSAGAGVSAAKTEVKVEPLNFFGYEPLEDFFGFDYDPYIGVDVSFGSLGAGGSLGMENSVYAALGIGIGIKFGLEEDKKDK
ncbi:MAG: T7SS effector LXG polymorphic toxin [Bacillota bacterium]